MNGQHVARRTPGKYPRPDPYRVRARLRDQTVRWYHAGILTYAGAVRRFERINLRARLSGSVLP